MVNGAPAGNDVTIRRERRVGSDSLPDAQARLSQLHVEVQEIGADLLVSTRQPQQSGGRSFVVDYRITLPAPPALGVANVNGSIHVSGTAGNVDTQLVNGRTEAALQVADGGAISLTGVNGDIVPQELVLQNEVRTSTTLQGTLGTGSGTVSLKTSIGSIRIAAST